MERALIAAAVGLVLLVAAVAFVYNFGTPSTAATEAPDDGTGESVAGTGGDAEVDTEVDADAVAPEPDPRSPLAIQIPGCKCHSDDPKLVSQHADYRMNQCAGCHKGGTPTGAP